jgi:CheY-like chemotaxis protein
LNQERKGDKAENADNKNHYLRNVGIMCKKKKALIIEDEDLVCRVIDAVLKRLNIESIRADNGYTALDRLNSEDGASFDLVIIDLVLPDGPMGWELIDHIRDNPATSDVIIIVLTGAKLSKAENGKIANKADAVILKPDFEINDFSKVLQNLLKK